MPGKQVQVLLHCPHSKTKKVKQIVTILTTITFEELLLVSNQHFGIRTEAMMLSYHTWGNVYLPLNQRNFEDYKATLKINKLIKVQVVDPLEATIEEKAPQRNQSNDQVNQLKNLIQLPPYEVKEASICSFFADDLHLIEPFLKSFDLGIQSKQNTKNKSSIISEQ